MKNRAFIPLLVTALLLIVLPANAFKIGDINLYITNETILNLNKTANNQEQFYEELSFFSKVKNFSSNFTLRLKNYFKQSPNQTLENPEFDLFRKSVHFRSKHVRISAGDFYSLLGRGLVLSVLKNDDIFKERTIQGLKADININKIGATILGGIIKDETNIQNWFLSGGEFRYKYGKKNSAGFHFSYVNDIDTFSELGGRFTGSVSMQGSGLFGYLSYYTEAAVLSYSSAELTNGKAIYSNLTYSRGHVTISAEYKYYKDFYNEMNNPPTADREDEISTLKDSSGGRVKFTYSLFDPDISLFINFGHYREYDSGGNHIYAGINSQDLFDKVTFAFSYGVRKILYPVKKFSADIQVEVNDTLSIELSSKDKRYKDGSFIFTESDHSIQLSLYPGLSVSFLYQFSHNAVMGLNNFFSANISLFLKKNLQITVAGGTIRGGQVCSGGQCFIMPPFKGIKFSILKIFK